VAEVSLSNIYNTVACDSVANDARFSDTQTITWGLPALMLTGPRASSTATPTSSC